MPESRNILNDLELSVQFVKEQIESGMEEPERVQQELLCIVGKAVQLSDAISEVMAHDKTGNQNNRKP